MIIDEDYNVDLYDMTVSGCESNEDGGAIINDGCLNLINVTFKDNKANFGGAIVSHHLISIRDSLFINNFASNGGALANTNYASAGIYNTIFQENSAVTMAGAIYNEHQSTMIIDNCTFTANTANNGGAIDNDQATLSVENSLFEENVCLDYAGAIYNRYYAKLTVKNNTFRHNQAIEDEGGVFYNYFKSTLIAENNEFRNNYAWNYGGIIFNDDSEATFTSNYIFNSTVGKFGGSVIYNANGAHATFEDNLIFNNTAITNGGAVYTASSDIDLIDNIFFGNKARQGGTLYFIGANTNNVINNYIIDSVAETNGGAIYNTANQPLTVMGNIIENNVAGQGAALYSTGEVIFIQNNVTDNTVTNPSSKVIYNTGKFTANANIFTNNTDGNDILMSESGTNTVNDNIYKANMLETSITPSEDLNISSNYNLEVNVNVKEVYNYIVNSGNIVVKVNDVEYATEAVVDGKATVTLKADDLEDENNVVVEYRSEGTDFQESYIEFTVFTLAKKDTMIIINPIEDVAYNDNISITGQFLNEDLKPLIKSNLRLIINGVTNSIKTDNKGMFEFTYTAVTTGENNLTVKYVGNSKYNACSNTTQFVVNKKDTAIIIDEISNTKINEVVEITGKFINADGSVLRNSNVKIIINGISTNVKTDNKGVFKLNYTANTTGEITVTVSYKGNSKYNGCEESVQFTVDKKDTKITVNKINDVNKGEQVTITGKFTNEDNKALVNSNVVVYIGEAHYTVKTNNKGIFTYSFTPKIVGLNEIMVAYMGNAKYNRFNTTTTFNVLDE